MTAGVSGACEGRFEAVRTAFAQNFSTLDEHGAAVAVWHDGRLVVDLWGGWRDRAATVAWRSDTLVCMMSVVKAVTALLVHVAADRRQIDLDAPVGAYWPEFTQGGKARVLVRHVLDHRAGVPGITRTLSRGAAYDWHTMAAAIAAEPARWPSGEVPAYHPVTMGFICGELIRRVTGRTPGAFLREVTREMAPFEYFIGIPQGALDRCAEIFCDYSETIFGATDPATLAHQSIVPLDHAEFNTPQFRRAEIPSINGHGTPRAVATLFGRLAECRAGVRSEPISRGALARATEEQWHGVEQTSGQERRMALGFLLGGVKGLAIPTANAFGHGGAGGALAFADPDLRLGFAYATSRLHDRIGPSPRTAMLVDAVMRCVR